jgi:hypothetical protein
MRKSELVTQVINNIAEEETASPNINDSIDEAAVDDTPATDESGVEIIPAEAENRADDNEAAIEETEVEEEQENNSRVLDTGGLASRRSARIAAGIKPPERFVHASFVEKSRWQEEAAQKAIVDEIRQLFKDLQALKPIKADKILAGACVLTCHMFIVEKFLADGKFDKMKARLVSHGNKQDKEQFPERSSPTVAIHSVLMVLAWFAGNMGEHSICKIDVKGAFVQTPMEGEAIYLKIGKDLAKHIVAELPEYKDFVTNDGILYARMLKAMYGCVQASLLWYKLLVQVLESIGFKVSEVDRCVMRLVVGDVVNIILIYVDDLLVFATRAVVDLILQTLKRRFTWLTVEREEMSFSYLGMQLILSEEKIVIDMQYYLQQILDNVSNLVRKAIPGGRETFQVTTDSADLDKENSEWYHTITAKLLYLGKRARPDILTVVSFLCTRVTKPTEEDMKKLMHLLGYLHATRTKVLTITKRVGTRIEMYVDAAYGLHEKGESHSGVVMLLGGVVVYVSSKKQKCIAKSPTDAEVVALSDNIDLLDLFHEFAEFISNKKLPVPMIYEDCKACIDLVKGAKGQIRTKQMRSRIYRVKEFLNNKKGEITFVKTEKMWADGASKTLTQPKQFASFAQFVIGEKTTTSQPVGVAFSNN